MSLCVTEGHVQHTKFTYCGWRSLREDDKQTMQNSNHSALYRHVTRYCMDHIKKYEKDEIHDEFVVLWARRASNMV